MLMDCRESVQFLILLMVRNILERIDLEKHIKQKDFLLLY